MSVTSRNKKVETLAWITDDEAEFWTSTSPIAKRDTTNQFSTIKDISPDVLSPDGLYFKINNEINTEMEDHLSLLHKQILEKQDEEVKYEDNETPVIFQSNENIQMNNNNTEKNMSLFDRLLHQLTRSSFSETDYIDDEVFVEVDENEIKVAVNNNNIHRSLNDGSKLTDNIPFINDIRSFIDEIGEETNVLLGFMDEESLINRRSRKAKSTFSSIKNN
ncbi:unnamed protein product [Rotaria magnacalcarata]|uniref:Uncharacterized protein n=1 Tax=Rotaria magnacalcarata TaxID=392030 RepID=A0A816MHW5_9BILA|nr:unnamed protein product [Rotaria magnacalcarata]CAF1593764.1 unnamed protein product [Rotaria magnacalcarata]CAF1970819.1 unnamed protein product [Rotaria magnacalcarata]CAF3778471.1 unnamed protein product [Rotaria magnacalcarata]CAF3812967.1 unnamed protein product [Rotaria magnacalcarata]